MVAVSCPPPLIDKSTAGHRRPSSAAPEVRHDRSLGHDFAFGCILGVCICAPSDGRKVDAAAAERRVLDGQLKVVTAKRLDDDRQAEPGALSVVVRPLAPPNDAIAIRDRDSGPVVIEADSAFAFAFESKETRTRTCACLRALSRMLPTISPKSSGSMRNRASRRSWSMPGEGFPAWHTLNGANESFDGLARVDERAAARSGAGHARATQLPVDVPVHRSRPAPARKRRSSRRHAARALLASIWRRVRGVLSPCARSPARSRARRTRSSCRASNLLRSSTSGAISRGNCPFILEVEAAVNAVQLLSDRVQWAQREARLDPYPKRQREADDAERDDALALK